PIRVLRVRRGDINGLDVAIGQQRVVIAEALGGRELIAELLGLGLLASGDGQQLAGYALREVSRERPGDGAGAEDAPVDEVLRIAHEPRFCAFTPSGEACPAAGRCRRRPSTSPPAPCRRPCAG